MGSAGPVPPTASRRRHRHGFAPVLRTRGVRRVIVLDASALVDAVLDSLLRSGFLSRSPARTSAPLRTSRRRCSPHCPGSSARARSSPAHRPRLARRGHRAAATTRPSHRCSPAARLRTLRAHPRAGRPVRRARRRARVLPRHHRSATGNGHRALRRSDPVVVKAGAIPVRNTPLPVLVVHSETTSTPGRGQSSAAPR